MFAQQQAVPTNSNLRHSPPRTGVHSTGRRMPGLRKPVGSSLCARTTVFDNELRGLSAVRVPEFFPADRAVRARSGRASSDACALDHRVRAGCRSGDRTQGDRRTGDGLQAAVLVHAVPGVDGGPERLGRRRLHRHQPVLYVLDAVRARGAERDHAGTAQAHLRDGGAVDADRSAARHPGLSHGHLRRTTGAAPERPAGRRHRPHTHLRGRRRRNHSGPRPDWLVLVAGTRPRLSQRSERFLAGAGDVPAAVVGHVASSCTTSSLCSHLHRSWAMRST